MTDIEFSGGKLLVGNCLERLAELPDESIDSIVTDPPYELSFMGKKWDASGIAYNVELWKQALRVLKPGGHLLAFGATRTYHRMAVAIEDAGFEIRDSIHWTYASGFPKSHNVAIALDKADKLMEHRGVRASVAGNRAQGENVEPAKGMPAHEPVGANAKRWNGWGSALKPSHEPIVVARKPLNGTIVETVLEHGTGAMNIAGCRIGNEERVNGPSRTRDGSPSIGGGWNGVEPKATVGRWPANTILTGEAVEGFDEACFFNCCEWCDDDEQGWPTMLYVSKPTPAERNAGCDGLPVSRPDNRTTVGMGTFDEKGVAAQQNAHPTVKPIALIRHLQRLVTQPGGITLDPFMGSGTGAVAATLEGFRWVGCELTEDYLPIIRGRVSWAEQEMRAGRSEKPSYKKVEQQQWTEPTLFE